VYCGSSPSSYHMRVFFPSTVLVVQVKSGNRKGTNKISHALSCAKVRVKLMEEPGGRTWLVENGYGHLVQVSGSADAVPSSEGTLVECMRMTRCAVTVAPVVSCAPLLETRSDPVVRHGGSGGTVGKTLGTGQRTLYETRGPPMDANELNNMIVRQVFLRRWTFNSVEKER
jgi:hypothetical protein